MRNILLIIQREYLTRVRKKSFIIMTILGPLLVSVLYGGIIWAAMSSIEIKKIGILDEGHLFTNKFKSDHDFSFINVNGSFENAKKELTLKKLDALVLIPKDVLETKPKLKIYSEDAVSIELQSKVEKVLEKEIEIIKLEKAGISLKTIDDSKVKVDSDSFNLKNNQAVASSAGASTIIALFCGFLIYISVMIYGTQVMRSITEEKTNRIVEILISSVKPFQLMIGKIIGVGLVGLTQFLLWIILSFGVMTVGGVVAGNKILNVSNSQTDNIILGKKEKLNSTIENVKMSKANELIKAMNTLPLGTIVVSFFLFFLGGYLFYSALFGAVGSAVDSETDTQQFMLPVTIPIIISMGLIQIIIRDPNSNLAFWASMIPFSSPIIMMCRIPFGVPIWQILLSFGLLVLGFIFTTWLASRIYKVGILMYGKKPTWKEIFKWIFYK